ncbi:MAG: glycine/sarcosine/betaine reductase selenoprotein B family protein [Thermaerobacter sp.]|nr:glycine/sarcosine/betaine reductase selenoprotein B family protein [Thermaerobacter sp.]
MLLLDPEELNRKHQRWIALVTEMHAEFQFTRNASVAWTNLGKPLSESTVALVCTAGIHLKSQPAYDLLNPHGDWSFREIPGDAPAQAIGVSHSHYDTEAPQRDIDCVFPIRTLRTLVARGVVGAAAKTHYGMMGFVPNGTPIVEETAPEIARRLAADGVDAALLTPG